MEYNLALKKGNTSIYDKMNELGEPQAKWNKPVLQRQIPHNFTLKNS